MKKDEQYKTNKRNCMQCKKIFFATGWSIKQGKSKFCSKSCSAKFYSIGDRNYFWRGGRTKTVQRYIHIWNPYHPRRIKGNYIPEQVLIMERKIGRLLENHEVVHHINGVKDDNRIENLKLMSITEHKKLHGKNIKVAIKGKKGFQKL